MMVEGQHVSRSLGLNLYSLVEPNGIDPKILNIDGNLGMKVIYRGLVVIVLRNLKMTIIPRTAQGHGWLRPAIGVLELSQAIIQAVPLSARKAVGGSSEGIAPFLQLPHFSEAIMKKLGCKKVRTFQELQDMTLEEWSELLIQVAGFPVAEVQDVEKVLEMMPALTLEVTC
ncbi:dnaJ protein ERDJ2A-like [Diospyros lotus]|uniref:dnaJ protein ERDJ2A-like n=1 Tax=Diospyros lotus TaxID=55363 RepID=UPI002259C0EC|nr:dnaJ protein ERDJ2A-like [Diospyros lotus]